MAPRRDDHHWTPSGLVETSLPCWLDGDPVGPLGFVSKETEWFSVAARRLALCKVTGYGTRSVPTTLFRDNA